MPYVSAAQCIRVRRSRWIHTLVVLRGAVLPSVRWTRVADACACLRVRACVEILGVRSREPVANANALCYWNTQRFSVRCDLN